LHFFYLLIMYTQLDRLSGGQYAVAYMAKKNLVIVESPAKAKTIAGVLGPDFEVQASYGHVRDLPKSDMGVDIEHDFTPTYIVTPQQKKRLAELKKLATGAETVWLATDEDREGEAIAWHLAEALKLDAKKTKRIAFHEITAPAIKRAIEQPRTIHQGLVDAQQARRVLDRLVGYELSPILWKKVQPGLSAGRVQSVALRLIVEREKEIDAHSASFTFKVEGQFKSDGDNFKAVLPLKLKDVDEARQLIEQAGGGQWSVASLETKPGKRQPAPPFTTSTLQQEASRKLGFSLARTMMLAQRLYEAGIITYMRTDSVHLSELAVTQAGEVITRQFGAKYAKRRQFATKTAGAQEAHEAIRPTDLSRNQFSGDPAQAKLYDLIWKRTVASQMTEAEIERTTAMLACTAITDQFQASGEMVKFDGFLKLYLSSKDDEDEAEEEGILPSLKPGTAVTMISLIGRQTFDRPKPRYTEASLVRQLEEMGIGRPSTYAPTIHNIQEREYVQKGDVAGVEREVSVVTLTEGKVSVVTETELAGAERNKLIPTPLGQLVSDFLSAHFGNVVDYDFTAKVEDEFDQIEDGKQRWNAMIADFYGPFHKTVEQAENISRQEASQARELGTDPATGKPVIARWGRYGPMVQLGSAEDEEKPRFAALPAGQKLDDATLEEALELFKLPRQVGTTSDGQPIEANFGRFGPYIKFGKLYVSIKPDDPFTITPERAQELVAEKLKAESEKYIKRFDDSEVAVVNGRYGPYVTDGKRNAKIPKGTEPVDLTLEDCKKLLDAAPTRRRRRVVR
jgi:DNA topoisomerase-1